MLKKIMSYSGEPNNMKGTRARMLDPKRNNLGASLDLSKASPSNGQCPTAVSSRGQTIPSRELQQNPNGDYAVQTRSKTLGQPQQKKSV